MRRFFMVIIPVALAPLGVLVANIAEPPGPVVGWDLVSPVFAEKCTICHDTELTFGGVDLSSYEAALAGDNPSAVPFDMGSPLVIVLTRQPDSGMRGPDHTRLLTLKEKALVFNWVERGCSRVSWGLSD